MDSGSISARQIMSQKFAILDEQTTLSELQDYFQKHKMKHIFVSSFGEIVGVVSVRDVLRQVSPFIATQAQKKQDEETLNIPATQIMTSQLLWVTPDEDIISVANKILEAKISCMPVCDDNKKILGVITWREFVPYLSDKITVDQVMDRRPSSVTMDTRLSNMMTTFKTKGIHHLPVIENGRILGMISDRDVLRLTSPFLNTIHEREQDREILRKRAHHIMVRKLYTISLKTTIQDAGQILLKQGISCLPIVALDNAIRGIVTWHDFLKHFVKQ